MKRINITLFLALYACVQTGMLAWDYYQPLVHFICGRMASHRPPAGKEVVITLDLAGYRSSLENEKEIRWQGSLYDIRQAAINGNQVTLVVEKDDIENRWLAFYDSISRSLRENRSQQGPGQLNRYQWLFKLYVPSAAIKDAPPTCRALRPISIPYNNRLPSFWPDGPFHPPDAG